MPRFFIKSRQNNSWNSLSRFPCFSIYSHCKGIAISNCNTLKCCNKFTSYFLAVLIYKYLHGLADKLHHPAEFKFRRRLRSASSHELSVPGTRVLTDGDRGFPVAAVRIWNSLRQHITCTCSVTSRLLLSPEDILLRTLLPVINVVVPAK